MATLKASPLLLLLLIFFAIFLAFINSATAEAGGLDANGVPQELKEFGALKDKVLESKIIDQIKGSALTQAANAPKSDATSKLANLLNSAPAPAVGGGKGKTNKFIEQLRGTAPAPAAAALKNADASVISNIFGAAAGPGDAAGGGGVGAAADALTKILNRGPAPEAAAGKQKEASPANSAGSLSHLASSFLCVGMVLGFVPFFVAL